MPDTLWAQVGAILTVLICAFAFLKGDDPERVGAGAYMLGWFAALLLQDDGPLDGIPSAIVGLDLTMLIVLSAIVWRWRPTWAVWACACQLLVVMSHVMSLIDVRPAVASFYTVINLASYGVLVSLGIGTFWAWQERRAAGLE